MKFHEKSVKFFGKLKAEYLFKDSKMRKQANEIILFHQDEIIKTKNEIHFSQKIIKKIDTPMLTPDGEKLK